MKNDKGIDYSGPGSTVNRDPETGIRYGIISCNSVSPESMDDIYTHGQDLDYEEHVEKVKSSLRTALSDYFSDYKWKDKTESKLDAATREAFDAIAERLGDNYESTGDCTRMRYEQDGYILQIDSSGDLWVIKSPYYTHAQFCSPCAPGACHLDNPITEKSEANKCYCLGDDWFENEKAPYSIYNVKP
jgi:hypothetical protein